jgi:hypothetical protein
VRGMSSPVPLDFVLELTLSSLLPENILPASTAAPGIQAQQKEASN